MEDVDRVLSLQSWTETKKILKIVEDLKGGNTKRDAEITSISFVLQKEENSFSRYTNCCIVQNFVWEKLNTGHWKEVWKGWRDLYACIALIRIGCVLHCIEQSASCKGRLLPVPYSLDTDVLEDLVKMADMGLLLGSPILGNALEKIAAVLTEILSLDCENLPAKIAKKDEEETPSSIHIDRVSVQLPASCQPLRKLPSVEQPSLEEFLVNHSATATPAIFTGCMQDWPAMSGTRRWNVARLVKLAGPRTVPVELGRNYTSSGWTQKLMTIKEFAAKHLLGGEEEVGYLAQHQLLDQVPQLGDDVVIPDFCYTGEDENEDVDINVWIGPKGTVSPLHTDPKQNLLCQVSGTKYVVLYPSFDGPNLYPHQSPILFNTSQVDLQNPRLDQFPDFVKACGWHTLLRPGEMVYIPAGVWHYVAALTTSFSVSFWWT